MTLIRFQPSVIRGLDSRDMTSSDDVVHHESLFVELRSWKIRLEKELEYGAWIAGLMYIRIELFCHDVHSSLLQQFIFRQFILQQSIISSLPTTTIYHLLSTIYHPIIMSDNTGNASTGQSYIDQATGLAQRAMGAVTGDSSTQVSIHSSPPTPTIPQY